jgi:hypothetical protein
MALPEFLNVRPGEVSAPLLGPLPEERAEESKQKLLRTGIPRLNPAWIISSASLSASVSRAVRC